MELRDLGVGCHIGGVWLGAAGYADDIILMAPSRTSMAMMPEKCEQYAIAHSLMFSTDPDPRKSKSKCLYMVGTMRNVTFPVNLKLNNEDLPWVETASHLGHELHQMCDMEYDCKVKRAMFIDNSTDIRETFSFAHPDQILSAVNLYAGHFYGGMLWDFSGNRFNQLCNSWNICVKLAWDVPRSTHTYLVDNLLGINHLSVKRQLLSRYTKFFRGLLKSKSNEVKLLSNIVARDVRSVTGKNLKYIENETGLDPWISTPADIRDTLPIKQTPEEDAWRLPLLCKLLYQRQEMSTNCQNKFIIEL